MKRSDEALLQLVRAALQGEKPADPQLSGKQWSELFRRADHHKLLPLVLDAAIALPSLRRLSAPQPGQTGFTADPDGPDVKALRQRVMAEISRQAIQENEFLNLILALRERGLEPMVVKGCLCRSLWPKPLLRPSVDDDLLIRPEQAPSCHAALLELGLTEDHETCDPETDWELSYHKPESPLYVELHKCLFDPDSPVFSGFNSLFAGAFETAERTRVQDVDLLSPAPEQHLLFLILHAYKHFLFSGFGLRIVADVCLYARQYTEEIDFGKISGICAELRCDRFTAALFRIGEKYLGVSKPMAFALPDVDESALLEDVLAAGLVGADIDRLHSANITLGAVADENQGKTRSGGLAKTLFPSAKKLSGRYPYLEKKPWLLPLAWVLRLGTYLLRRDSRGASNPKAVDPASTIRIGAQRVALLRKYGILE
jgi:hypothetical protein